MVPYEVNSKLVTGNGSLIPSCSLSNSSLMPSLTVPLAQIKTFKMDSYTCAGLAPDENLDSTLICTSNSSSPRDIFYTPRTEITTPMILRRKVLAGTSTKLIGSIDEREHLVDERSEK